MRYFRFVTLLAVVLSLSTLGSATAYLTPMSATVNESTVPMPVAARSSTTSRSPGARCYRY
jgi:hypothetical protein